MKLVSVKKENLNSLLDLGKNYGIIEFNLRHEYLNPAVLKVICSEKIDDLDLEEYFALIDLNGEVIFVGSCKFPIDHSTNSYVFEAIPADLDAQIEEIKKSYSSFEQALLYDCPVYITSKDLKVYSIVSKPKSISKVVLKENIYSYSIKESKLPNFQFNLILNSLKTDRARVSANKTIFGEDGIECSNPNDLISSWSKYIQSSIIHEATKFSVEKAVFQKVDDLYSRSYKVGGNIEFNINYENRIKEIVELNIKTSDSAKVVVLNLPIDVTDYIIDSKRWQKEVNYREGDIVVFVEGGNAIFAVCIEDHLSSEENFCSTLLWKLAEKKSFFEVKDFFFFSSIGKEIFQSISRYINLYIRLNYPLKILEFEAPLDKWFDIDIGVKLSCQLDEMAFDCIINSYTKFCRYDKEYVRIRASVEAGEPDEATLRPWEEKYGPATINFDGLKIMQKAEIVDFNSNQIVNSSLYVQKNPSGQLKLRVPDGAIFISERMIRLRGYITNLGNNGDSDE